jgi:hypothetical protein
LVGQYFSEFPPSPEKSYEQEIIKNRGGNNSKGDGGFHSVWVFESSRPFSGVPWQLLPALFATEKNRESLEVDIFSLQNVDKSF